MNVRENIIYRCPEYRPVNKSHNEINNQHTEIYKGMSGCLFNRHRHHSKYHTIGGLKPSINKARMDILVNKFLS